MRALIAALLLFFAGACAAETLAIRGAVAYTDILRYDYTGDGKRNRVQFWLEFDGRVAAGAPANGDPESPNGTIRYFLKDADDGTKVVKWRHGLDMQGAPRDTPLPMTNLVIEGNTARFEAFDMKWTVIDGGEGYPNDKIVVHDGFKASETKKLYGGDVRIGPAQ
jgi:hypothetical protein